MKSRKVAFVFITSLMAFVPSMADASVDVDFNSFELGAIYNESITLGGATFSSGSGLLKIVDQGGKRALCAFDGVGCGETLGVSFDPGVSDFVFTFAGDEVAGSAILWQGQTSALSFIGQISADGDPSTVHSQYIRVPDLKLIDFTPRNGNSVSFTSFSFTSAPAAVPEPASWALMLSGFGLIGAALRTRKNIKSHILSA